MRMIRILAGAGLCILALTATLTAAVPQTTDFQGRLTSSSGVPVPDGAYPARFSLYLAETGGMPVWSETADIQCSSGLFSAKLGGSVGSLGDVYEQHADQAADAGLWLEVTVTIGGTPQTMTPRTQISSVPYARGAQRVVDDTIATGPVTILAGVAIPKFISMTYNNAKTNLEIQDGPRVTVSLGTDWSLGGSQCRVSQYDPLSLDLTGDSKLYTSSSDAGNNVNWNFEGGGGVKSSSSISASSGGVSHRFAWNSVADLGHPNQQVNVRLVPTDQPDPGIHSEMMVDIDADGTYEGHRWEKVDNTDMVSGMAVDSDDDGITDGSITNTASSEMLRRRLVFVSGSTGTCSLMDSVGTTSAKNVLSIQNGTAPASPNRSISSSVDASSVAHSLSTDEDGDNDPESELSQHLTPTTSSLAIKTKGTSAQRFSAGGDCDDGDAVMYTDCDDDNDGLPEARATMSSSSTAVSISTSSRFGFGPRQTTSMDGSFSHASSRCETDSDNDGNPDASVVSTSSSTEASQQVSSGSKNIGLYVSEVSGQSSIAMTSSSSGTLDTAIIIDGALKRFGIGIAEPDAPIHHSSGARLTAGGDWINASDENLKENFRSVDGEELLEKIEELEIKEWNYKNQDDDVKHIGPTAQEFKETFGLGENDKSISTIDPSGIALAAIKQLKKENDELKQQLQQQQQLLDTRLRRQNEELSAQVEALTRMVQKLSEQK